MLESSLLTYNLGLLSVMAILFQGKYRQISSNTSFGLSTSLYEI